MTQEACQFKQFLAYLWQGGEWGHYRSFPCKISDWVATKDLVLPTPRSGEDVYFGVNPCYEIPRANAKGKVVARKHIGGQNKYIGAINCVYGDFDGKDFDAKDRTGRGKELALQAIEKQGLQPSVIVDSGGGFHAYWLLDEPFILDNEEKRQRATQLQDQWIECVGADAKVHDLARIMRVVGTQNHRKAYTNAPLPVKWVEFSLDLTYSIAELEERLPLTPPQHKTQSMKPRGNANNNIAQRSKYWACALETAARMVQTAPDGTKHSELLKAARLVGGYLAGGMGNEQDATQLLESEIENRANVASMDVARDTIRDGLAHGKNAAIPFEQLERERQEWESAHKLSNGTVNFYAPPTQEKDAKDLLPMKDAMLDYALGKDITLFTDQHRNALCETPCDDHYEILPIDGKNFEDWLSFLLYTGDGRACSKQTLDPAQRLLRAMALFEGDTYNLYNRVAWGEDGALYYDMTDTQWRALKVNTEGWEVVSRPPLLFRRYKHQDAQVMPERVVDSSKVLEDVFRFVNLRRNGDNGDSQLLFMVYLVSLLIPDIAHPIPILHGEQGTGKTYAFKTIRTLIDPSNVKTLGIPWKSDEFVQQLDHHWCAFYDNVSSLSEWQQDVLCRAVTGEGHTKRLLYSNDDDMIYTYKRCIALNGINVTSARPDLLDRSILFEWTALEEGERETETNLREAFDELRPQLLGGILDILVKALRVDINTATEKGKHFRLADWATWGYRIAEALGGKGDKFIEVYGRAVGSKSKMALELHPLGIATMAFMEDKTEWSGTPKSFLNELRDVAEREGINTDKPPWPKGVSWLGRRLKEVKPDLRANGVVYYQERGESRQYTITKTENADSTVSIKEYDSIPLTPLGSYCVEKRGEEEREGEGGGMTRGLKGMPSVLSVPSEDISPVPAWAHGTSCCPVSNSHKTFWLRPEGGRACSVCHPDPLAGTDEARESYTFGGQEVVAAVAETVTPDLDLGKYPDGWC